MSAYFTDAGKPRLIPNEVPMITRHVPSPLPHAELTRFVAESKDVNDDLDAALLEMVLEWQLAHPDHALIAIEFDQDDDHMAVCRAKGYVTDAERLMAYIRNEVTFSAYAILTHEGPSAVEALLDAVEGDDPDTMQPCVGCDSTVSRLTNGGWAHDETGHGDHEPRPHVALRQGA